MNHANLILVRSADYADSESGRRAARGRFHEEAARILAQNFVEESIREFCRKRIASYAAAADNVGLRFCFSARNQEWDSTYKLKRGVRPAVRSAIPGRHDWPRSNAGRKAMRKYRAAFSFKKGE